MAKTNQKNTPNLLKDRSIRKNLLNINNLIGRSNLSLYGTDRTSDIDNLDAKFQSILTHSIGDMTNKSDTDITSFLSRLVSKENKDLKIDEILNNQLTNLTGENYGILQSFIFNAYRNRILEQSDLQEISEQLIELSESIMITRDAIISADVVEGRMSRTLVFDNINENEVDDYISITEQMETKFKLLEKIKNFIIPKTLQFGEYYVYVIPYSKLFDDFKKSQDLKGRHIYSYNESTIFESFSTIHNNGSNKNEFDLFVEKCYNDFYKNDESNAKSKGTVLENKISKNEFKNDLSNIMNNITVCNEDIPLPILEEGLDSIQFLKEKMDRVVTEDKKENMFEKVLKSSKNERGIQFDNKSTKNKDKNEFQEIGDCYLKMLNPTKVIPIEIMNTVLGYVLITDEGVTPLGGSLSSTLFETKFNEHSRQATIIDSIAERVALSFDKPFLKKNLKFKEAIVDCLNYYNLNENKIRMQFIPSEYIVSFKIDEDENGKGTSMIKKSLFYAKLYLMILLFKIMSIVLYSNDQKINYVRQSGIDKNVANKVEEIIRINQSRQINITDLFSYTNLINKIGNGNTIYMPVGRSGERPIETEILSGQEIQLNNDLMEMLKNSYILGTGTPAAIINYLSEVEFAKVAEQNNTKYNGRIVNYQLDFNPAITTLYKKIMLWSTNIPEHVVSTFKFILQPPKATPINTKNDLINQYTTLSDFLIGMLFEDPNNTENQEEIQGQIREFKMLLARDQLPMIDFDKMVNLKNKALVKYLENKLKPKSSNGDNGDDDGLEEEFENLD